MGSPTNRVAVKLESPSPIFPPQICGGSKKLGGERGLVLPDYAVSSPVGSDGVHLESSTRE